MASLTKVRLGYFVTNFTKVFAQKSSDLQKCQRALFHFSSFLNGQGQEIKMPSLSPTMTEGKIVKWLKKEGDVVNPGDVLCDIETDKAIVSMEVDEEGVLARILVPENSSTIKVGSLIALMVNEGEDWKNVDVPTQEGTPSSTSGTSENISQKTAATGPPTISVNMPSLSPTMTAGTIVKWIKKEGDTVAPGDVLCEIQTDKAVMSMETEEEGILAKIILPDDSKDVKVGTLIALLVAEGEDWKSVVVPSDSVEEKKSTSQPQSIPTVATGSGDFRSKSFGPAVKALLSSYQLEPGLIKATGRNNRLLKEDVLNYIADNKLEKKPPKVVSVPSVQPKQDSVSQPQKTSKTTPPGSKYTDIELTNMRKVIAKRLLESKQQIPHTYSTVKCDVARLVEVKDVLNEYGTKVSLNDLLTKATALALQLHPKANSLCVNNEVKSSREIDVCVAVATDQGLFTPIIRSTNSKSVSVISQEIRDLATKAKNGKLKPEEYQGGTFTISNLGMFGIKHFSAIINPPQCGILAIGGTVESLNSNLETRKEITLTLSYDRRAMEEHEAAEFMEALKYLIENPKLIASDRFSNSSAMAF